jgi:hypothetical protein
MAGSGVAGTEVTVAGAGGGALQAERRITTARKIANPLFIWLRLNSVGIIFVAIFYLSQKFLF